MPQKTPLFLAIDHRDYLRTLTDCVNVFIWLIKMWTGAVFKLYLCR